MLQNILNEIENNNGVVNKKELIRNLDIDPNTLDGMLALLNNSGKIKLEIVQNSLTECAVSCSNCKSRCF